MGGWSLTQNFWFGGVLMKKSVVYLVVFVILFTLAIFFQVLNNSVSASTLDVPVTTITTVTTTTGTGSLSVVTTKKNTIGSSKLDISINTKKDYSVALHEFSNSFLVDDNFYKEVRTLYIEVVSAQNYTLDRFRECFIAILQSYNISVTDEVISSIDDYAMNYLSDYLVSETNPTQLYLSSSYNQLVIVAIIVILIFVFGGIKY